MCDDREVVSHSEVASDGEVARDSEDGVLRFDDPRMIQTLFKLHP